MIAQLCPVVAAPKFSPLAAATDFGHRVVVAQDGLWLDVRQPWIRATVQIAESAWSTPYGVVKPAIDLLCDREHLAGMFSRFLGEADARCPVEHAAWVSVDDNYQLAYHEVEVLAASRGSISYRRPSTPGRHPFLDLHSHGEGRPFFSATDNRDDVNEMKLAIVVGDLGRANHSASFCARLCLAGLYVDVTDKLAKIMGLSGESRFALVGR